MKNAPQQPEFGIVAADHLSPMDPRKPPWHPASSPTVELDFFRMERETAFAEPPMKLLDRKRSFRDIQGEISKINPEIVRAVIASGSADATTMENCDIFPQRPGKKQNQILSSPLPLCNPMYSCDHPNKVKTAPMTIFYNGIVAVYNVPHQQAENILKVAEKAADSSAEINPDDNMIAENEGSMPLTRKKSLRRFLEKRKERQINS